MLDLLIHGRLSLAGSDDVSIYYTPPLPPTRHPSVTTSYRVLSVAAGEARGSGADAPESSRDCAKYGRAGTSSSSLCAARTSGVGAGSRCA